MSKKRLSVLIAILLVVAIIMGIIVAKNRENLVKWINSKHYLKILILIIWEYCL